MFSISEWRRGVARMMEGGGPSIMESLEHIGVNGREEEHFQPATGMVGGQCSKTSLPDVLSTDLQSLALHGGIEDSQSFLLMDHTEQLSITSPSELCARLGCDSSAVTKVVSILGKTGEGKSHTLNQTFFCGEEVFPTSNQQTSCTSGVWASFEPSLQALVLDTEGMLGTSHNENVRTRLLLKVTRICFQSRFSSTLLTGFGCVRCSNIQEQVLIIALLNTFQSPYTGRSVCTTTCFTFWEMLPLPTTNIFRSSVFYHVCQQKSDKKGTCKDFDRLNWTSWERVPHLVPLWLSFRWENLHENWIANVLLIHRKLNTQMFWLKLEQKRLWGKGFPHWNRWIRTCQLV